MAFDPTDPYGSILEWSTKDLAAKRMGQSVMQFGVSK